MTKMMRFDFRLAKMAKAMGFLCAMLMLMIAVTGAAAQDDRPDPELMPEIPVKIKLGVSLTHDLNTAKAEHANYFYQLSLYERALNRHIDTAYRKCVDDSISPGKNAPDPVKKKECDEFRQSERKKLKSILETKRMKAKNTFDRRLNHIRRHWENREKK